MINLLKTNKQINAIIYCGLILAILFNFDEETRIHIDGLSTSRTFTHPHQDNNKIQSSSHVSKPNITSLWHSSTFQATSPFFWSEIQFTQFLNGFDNGRFGCLVSWFCNSPNMSLLAF